MNLNGIVIFEWGRINNPSLMLNYDGIGPCAYRNPTRISFCYLLTPIFRGEFRTFFTNVSAPKKNQWTTNCPENLHAKNEVVLWPLTSSKIMVLVAQPISTDGGPPAWAVDKRAELGWPSSRGKGWPAVCKSGPRLCSFTVFCLLHNIEIIFLKE